MHGQFTLRIHQLAVIAGRAGRWLLPWACVLVLSMTVAYIAGQALVAVSASLAYAMNVVVGGGSPAPEGTVGAPANVVTAERSATSALFRDEDDWTPCHVQQNQTIAPTTRSRSETVGIGQQYVGLNTWIPGEPPQVSPCPHGEP
jgi:hypothetical protein